MDQTPDFYQRAIEKLFLIVDKNAQTRPFTLNEPQTKILFALSRRDIILKARQEGISSLILAIFCVDFLTMENVRCVVISHESKATQMLFDRAKFYVESLKATFPGEVPYDLDISSRSEMRNKAKNSSFYIGTAGSKAVGRGDTIFNLHCSELAFWPDEERTMLALMQSVPKNGRVIVETTANGIGDYFYRLWTHSGEATSPFKRHFLPWFALSDYQLPIKGTFIPSDEEQELVKAHNLTHEQLNWRRWKIGELGGNIDTFNQEFPATAEEAFIVSGNPIWPPTLLKRYLNRCKEPGTTGNLTGAYQVFFDENPKGNLKIWVEPKVGHSYVMGADVAEGIEVIEEGKKDDRRDYSCAVVMDRQTAEIVAVWHGRIDGDQFGRQLDLLGRFYNDALVGVENNFQGLAPLIMLRDLNYPHLYYQEKIGLISDKMTQKMGWKTDRYTRPMMIDEASKWLREERLLIYDKEIVNEMMSFVRWPDGTGRAAQGAHDDRIMSLMICIQMYIRNPSTQRGNEIERPDSSGAGGDSLGGGSPIDIPDGGGDMGMDF